MKCVFCNSEAATTQDHIPPKGFFDAPYPPNLITVPACEPCRVRDQADDRLMRNLFISFMETEGHRGVAGSLAGRRDKSFQEDAKMALRLAEMMVPAEVCDAAGNVVGIAPAFNLKNPKVDRFIERISRGVISHSHGVAYFPAEFSWVLQPGLPREMISRAEQAIPQRDVGDIFHYLVTNDSGRVWYVLLTFFQHLQILARLETTC